MTLDDQVKAAWERLHSAEVEGAKALEAAQTSTLPYKPVAVTRVDILHDGIDKINIPVIIPPHIRPGNKWFDWASTWYKVGADQKPCGVRPGIDPGLALQNLVVIIRSKRIPPRNSIKACAYLASLWFDGLEENKDRKD